MEPILNCENQITEYGYRYIYNMTFTVNKGKKNFTKEENNYNKFYISEMD